MFDRVIYRPPKKVKLRWSKSSRLFENVAFLVMIYTNITSFVPIG